MNTLNGDIPMQSEELVTPFETHVSHSGKKDKRTMASAMATENPKQTTFQSYVAE